MKTRALELRLTSVINAIIFVNHLSFVLYRTEENHANSYPIESFGFGLRCVLF